MILIKDRHHEIIKNKLLKFFLGNMILIKDRHRKKRILHSLLLTLGKYDTYKGSTLDLFKQRADKLSKGKYDTYKGSTLD